MPGDAVFPDIPQNLFRLLLEEMSDTAWAMDLAFHITWTSPNISKVRGFSRNELMTMPLPDQLAPASLLRVREAMVSFLEPVRYTDSACPPSVTLDLEYNRKIGGTFRGETVLNLIRDSEGRPEGVFCVCRMITECEKTENENHSNELPILNLFEGMHQAVVMLNREGIVTYVNPSLLKMSGWSGAELTGFSWFGKATPGSDEIIASFQDVISGKVPPGTFEGPIFCRDGSRRLLSWNNSLIRGKDGTTVGTISMGEDITEQRHAEEALIASEERYRLLFENQSGGFALHEILLDQNGKPVDYRFLEINPAFEQITGLRAADLVGKTVLEVLPSTESYWIETYGKVAMEGKPIDYENYSLELDRYYEVRAFSPRRGQFAVIIHDITERKQAEEATRLNENRLESLLKINQFPSGDIQSLLDFALNEAITLTGSRIGYIYFYDETQMRFALNTWSREVMAQCTVTNPQTLYDLEKTGIWGEAVRQRRPIMINDFSAPNPLKKGMPEGHAALSNFLTIPVFSENRIVAVVGVANKRRDYNASDVRQLTLMMDTVWKMVERRFAEDKLRETRDYLENLLDYANAPIIVWDRDYIISRFNRAFQNLTGIAIHDAVGQPVSIVFPEESRETEMEQIRGTTGERWETVEFPILDRRTGETRTVLWNSAFILAADGKTIEATIAQGVDITERRKAEYALRENETRLRFALEGANDGIWDVNMATGAVYISPRGCEIMGYPPNEMKKIARVWNDLVHPEDMPLTMEKLSAYLEGREAVFMVEQRLKTKSGGWIWVLTRGKAVERDAAGNPIRMTGTHTDITQRKIADDALRESEQRYRAFFEQAAVGVAEVDSITGRYLRVNRRFAAITGRTVEDLLSENYQSLTHPDDLEISEKMVKALRDGEIPDYTIDKRYFRPDGEPVWVRISVSPLWGPGDKPLRHMAVVEDISARRKAEEEIRSSMERFRFIFQSSPFPIAIDRLSDGLLLAANQAAFNAYHADESYVGRITLTDSYLDPSERPRIIELLKRDGFIENRQMRIRNAEHKEVDYIVNMRLIEWEGQQAILMGFMDITQRLLMEEKLHEVNLRLEARVHEEVEISRQKDAALLQQARHAAMGEMLRNIAHQWRQPLNAVGLVMQNIEAKYDAEILTKESLSHSIRKGMALIHFMSQTIEDFRELYRSDRFLERFDVRALLQSAVSMVIDTFRSLSIDLVSNLEQPVFAAGFPNELHQVLLNLFNNTIDAFNEHPNPEARVELSLSVEGGMILIRLSDNAGGIPKDILSRIFDPYFTTREKGSGIGLYLCKTIVEDKMKGKISAENSGNGATFLIRIPSAAPKKEKKENKG